MNWTCGDEKPSTRSNKFHACESVPAIPTCPSNKFLSSGTLKYGRWDNSVCPGPGVNATTPASFEIFNIPAACLQGTSSCNLGNLTQNFGDPLPTVYKQVRASIYIIKRIYVLSVNDC